MTLKFSEYKYEQPDLESLRNEFKSISEKFINAQNANEQIQLIERSTKLSNYFGSMFNVGCINFSIDTTNTIYETARNYFNDSYPVFGQLEKDFSRLIISSKYRSELEMHFGSLYFKMHELSIKLSDPSVTEFEIKENNLVTEYSKLLATAKIPFEGKEYNIGGLIPFMSSTDRQTRKKAQDAKWKFFDDNKNELDKIFDELVKVRDLIAKKLGYKNYIQYAYDCMGRIDYGQNEVAQFRENVLKYALPVSTKLKQKQAARLGLDKLMYYDAGLDFNSGNAKPKGNSEWILNNAKIMYDELSPETSEFFNYMLERELMDLDNKPGKEGGGFCAYIDLYKSPFIFSNMNGTDHDVVVLTHEAGHAYQNYCSREIEIRELQSPGAEACEIHSMSMELMTFPWMHLFFKEDTEKFKFSLVANSIAYLPFGSAGDEFQHRIYENPDMAPEERNKVWLELEDKYLPDVDNSGNDFLCEGRKWQSLSLIYERPFYFIDYAMAQMSAYEFWKRSTEDLDKAMKDYTELCKAGGTKPFLELLKLAKLNSPFDEEAFKNNICFAEDWLNKIDDSKF
ncbi:M3 family oligoendopeptidase [soil metagenome]